MYPASVFQNIGGATNNNVVINHQQQLQQQQQQQQQCHPPPLQHPQQLSFVNFGGVPSSQSAFEAVGLVGGGSPVVPLNAASTAMGGINVQQLSPMLGGRLSRSSGFFSTPGSPQSSPVTLNQHGGSAVTLDQHPSTFIDFTAMRQHTQSNSPSTQQQHMHQQQLAAATGHQLQGNFQGSDMSAQFCAICNDRATGKHYGANSCDGCKGFFRRTIRRSQEYSCRFSGRCVIDKDHRNSCRSCRFEKCIQAGMRRDAVQKERDPIMTAKRSSQPRERTNTSTQPPANKITKQDSASPPPTYNKSPTNHKSAGTMEMDIGSGVSSPPNGYIEMLLKAEAICKQLRNTVITRTSDQAPSPTSLSQEIENTHLNSNNEPTANTAMRTIEDSRRRKWKTATIEAVTESMHHQLLLMVEWAKTLKSFTELPMEDQITLLRQYSSQYLTICVAYRSRHMKPTDALLLLNEHSVLPRDHADDIPDFNNVTARILDELVDPIRQFRMDESEYVALKAIVFFNPFVKGLESVEEVKATRQAIVEAFEHYIRFESSNRRERSRLTNLLLLLPPLQAIAQCLIEDVQLARLFGMAKIDSLLEELMLNGREEPVAGGSAMISYSQRQQGAGSARTEQSPGGSVKSPWSDANMASPTNSVGGKSDGPKDELTQFRT